MNDEMTIIKIIRASKNPDEAAETAVILLQEITSRLNEKKPEETT